MRSPRLLVSATILALIIISPAWSGPTAALQTCDLRPPPPVSDTTDPQAENYGVLYLQRVGGDLDIYLPSSTDTYTAYFHVPIPYGDQAPVFIDVQSPHLIDYRFVHLSPNNMIVAARLQRAPYTMLSWEAWVLVRPTSYAGMPWEAPIPGPGDYPESVTSWLEPSDCVQSSDPMIEEIAAEVRGDDTLLQELAEHVARYCWEIPWSLPHEPIAFDAYYAFNWGSSCTGHAHAGAALFRANGVPARSLHVIPIPTFGDLDMHWIIEYFVPSFGWARMETSNGWNLVPSHVDVITHVCDLPDEFPLYYPSGIEAHWHTSDPALGTWIPDWGRAHYGYSYRQFHGPAEQLETAFELTREIAIRHSHTQGLKLDPRGQPAMDAALISHQAAFDAIRQFPLADYIDAATEALEWYEQARPGATSTIYFDDFESPGTAWSHGGAEDEWELGVPSVGAASAHSGTRCWGTDLDGTYENNADNWLLSPPFDLRGFASADLSFYVNNRVQDRNQGYVHDPLWLDVTTDGRNFTPLSSHMGGVNDDPEIPSVGGWSHIVLDLAPYLDQESVQIRFRFQSDAAVVQAGSYIDDVHVRGRTRAYHPPRVEIDQDVELTGNDP